MRKDRVAKSHLLIENGEEAVSGGVHAIGNHDITAHHGGVCLLVVLTEPALALLHHLHNMKRCRSNKVMVCER